MTDQTGFEKALHALKGRLHAIRTSRANPSVLDDVRVEAYGTLMKVHEVASISVPEPQMLVIQPWDKTVLKALEGAIRDSNLHLNPVVDGEMIRIPFAPLTEERRKELIKIVDKEAEEARIAIRKVREELMKEIKDQEKEGLMSEDDRFREEKEIQSIVDLYNGKIKEMTDKKGKELMTI